MYEEFFSTKLLQLQFYEEKNLPLNIYRFHPGFHLEHFSHSNFEIYDSISHELLSYQTCSEIPTTTTVQNPKPIQDDPQPDLAEFPDHHQEQCP